MRVAILKRLLAAALIVPMTLVGMPQLAMAAPIGTQTLIELETHQNRLDRVRAMMAREEVREAMIQLGVAPEEAQQRVLALSPEELVLVEQHLDSLPTGAGGEVILVILGVVFLVLLVLELTGTIDIFKKA